MTGQLIDLKPSLPTDDAEGWADVTRTLALAARSAERADADAVAKHLVAAHKIMLEAAVKTGSIAKLWAKIPYRESFLEDDLAAIIEGAARQVRDLVSAWLDLKSMAETLKEHAGQPDFEYTVAILKMISPALERLDKLVTSTAPSAHAALTGKTR